MRNDKDGRVIIMEHVDRFAVIVQVLSELHVVSCLIREDRNSKECRRRLRGYGGGSQLNLRQIEIRCSSS
jgi:hypothetical protein